MTQDLTMNRKHRNHLATIIRQYLDGAISAFEFDDLVDPYGISDDATVTYVALTVWSYYDDCKDHHVNLTRPEWNYFQRLLLLLDSNDHIVETTTLRWSVSQLAAAFSLLAFGIAAFQFDFGIHLLLIAVPLGLISICIARFRDQREHPPVHAEILVPFSTFAELKTTYDAVPRFRKHRHPRNLPDRRIRSATIEIISLIPSYCLWVVLSPVPLFVQMFPKFRSRTRVNAA